MDNKQVLTDPRGIFTKPPKKGISNDALFSNLIIEEKSTTNRVKELNDRDREEYIMKVKSRKKGASPDSEYKFNFKPAGPQDYVDL